MGYRYRIAIDICDRDGQNVSSNLLKDIQDAMFSAAKVTLTPEVARNVKIEKVYGTDCYHSHDGRSECSGCYRAAEDAKDGDVAYLFEPKTILIQ